MTGWAAGDDRTATLGCVKGLFVVAALVSSAIVVSCGSDDDDGDEQAASSPDTTTAHLDLSVAPTTGQPTSVIRVRFESQIRLGPTPGGRRRSYHVVARLQRETGGCVEERDTFVDHARSGQRVTARIDPARGKGGELGWCRGRYRAKVRYYDGLACPATGRCDKPEGFMTINRVVARFQFRIE
jgi:hypothetical protein